MAKKLSTSKINKIIEYKNAGYSQHHTAAKLHINQSTVCHYWNKFDVCAKVEGLEAATEKYGGGDATEINAFAAEMKKENLSLPDAKAGFKMVQLFEKLEVWPEGYESAIKACLKINNEEGFLDTAAELVELEEKLGDSGLGVIANLEVIAKKLQEAQGQLGQLNLLIKSAKKELYGLKEKRQAATKEFEQHMKYLGLTLHRLELVQNLSLTLKKAGISDEAVATYLKRQALLDEANLDLGLLASILKQAKIVTAPDGGQALLGALNEYGGLTGACAELKAEVKSLKGQVANLEQQAALKGKLEVEVGKLKAEKASLEPHVADLHTQYQTMVMLQNDIAIMAAEKTALEQKTWELETRIAELSNNIEIKEKKVVDLKAVESKRDAFLKETAELQAKFEQDQRRWNIYQSFLGLVLKGSIAEMKKFSEVLPLLLEDLERGEYKPGSMKSHILQKLAGPELLVFKCMTCQETFRISNPMPSGGYYCPKCGFTHNVVVYKDAAVIVKGLLAEVHQPIAVKKTIIEQIEPKDEGN